MTRPTLRTFPPLQFNKHKQPLASQDYARVEQNVWNKLYTNISKLPKRHRTILLQLAYGTSLKKIARKHGYRRVNMMNKLLLNGVPACTNYLV